MARERLMADWRAMGLEVRCDAAANLLGQLPARRPAPAIWVGSHLDTVPHGGMFDGALGVLAATEALRCLVEGGYRPQHPLAAVNFTAEEPGAFRRSTIGSRAVAGRLDPSELDSVGPDGRRLADALRELGGDPTRIESARLRAGELAAYLELHVEQGRVLFDAGVPLGVVTRITGIRRLHCAFAGEANHAGTTRMRERRDALAGAAELVTAVERAALQAGEPAVATVGQVHVWPNTANVVAGRAEVVVELRSPDDDRLEALTERVTAEARAVATRRGLGLEIRRVADTPPVAMDAGIRQVLLRAAEAQGCPVLELPSMAGHDAAQVAFVAPAGMLFVASREGRSHSPQEWSEPEAVGAAAQVLLDALVELDATLE